MQKQRINEELVKPDPEYKWRKHPNNFKLSIFILQFLYNVFFLTINLLNIISIPRSKDFGNQYYVIENSDPLPMYSLS